MHCGVDTYYDTILLTIHYMHLMHCYNNYASWAVQFTLKSASLHCIAFEFALHLYCTIFPLISVHWLMPPSKLHSIDLCWRLEQSEIVDVGIVSPPHKTDGLRLLVLLLNTTHCTSMLGGSVLGRSVYM